MKAFISMASVSKKTILLLCSIVALSLALFSSCAFAVQLQQTTLNTDSNVSFDNNFVQAKASLSIHSNALLNDVHNGTITNSHMFNLVSHQNNGAKQDSKTTPMNANNQPITLNATSSSDVIAYMQGSGEGCNWINYYYDININGLINDLQNVPNADIYLNEDIALNDSLKILDGQTVSIHLCGHVLSGAKIDTTTVKEVQIIQVCNNATLTIEGSENDTQANQAHTLSLFDNDGNKKQYNNVHGGIITAGIDYNETGITVLNDNSTVNLNNTTIFGCVNKNTYGGGINILGANTKLSLDNSHIQYCSAENGGGINIEDTAKKSYISLVRSSIEYNHADDHGAGIYCDAEGVKIEDNAYSKDDESTRSTISNNKADDDGGGIYGEATDLNVYRLGFNNNNANSGGATYNNAKEIKFFGCAFIGNTANNKGGGACVDDINNTFSNCTFTGNKANTGGGIRINALDDNTTVSCCGFYYNTATKHGGGAYVNSKNNTFYECIFAGNKATSDGGGTYVKGGTYADVDVSVYNEKNKFRFCAFSDNNAENGGGAYLEKEYIEFNGCTFTGNTSNKAGSALYDNNDKNTLRDCTITENISKSKEGAVYVCSTVDIILVDKITVSNNTGCDIYLAEALWWRAYIMINPNTFDTQSSIGVFIEDIDDEAIFAKTIKGTSGFPISAKNCFHINNGSYSVARDENDKTRLLVVKA